MNYSYLYQTLKEQFSSGVATHSPDESVLLFSKEQFISHTNIHTEKSLECSAFDIELCASNPNNNFTYPLIRPNTGGKADACIVMLHGLNERSWEKYLPWAYTLANYANKPVILFPIAYHMNRSPLDWRNPRLMNPHVKKRINQRPDVSDLSIANVALSERLTQKPERFLLSGYQAANDLIDLTTIIQSGQHPMFSKDTNVDLFSYSIGSFLAQVLMLAHGSDYFANTKVFNFCGGSAFADINGKSKYIMDSVAFDRLHYYYKNEMDVYEGQNSLFYEVVNHTALGDAFRSMISLDKLKKRSANYLSVVKDRISSVVLQRDTVFKTENVKQVLKGASIEEWDFNFKYSHVTPFPLLSNKLVNQVNEAFDRLMVKAALLFTT